MRNVMYAFSQLTKFSNFWLEISHRKGVAIQTAQYQTNEIHKKVNNYKGEAS